MKRLPEPALDLLSGADGRYSEWATACTIATYAMNAGYTEGEFVRLVSESDFAYDFATENGRDRSNRLESRLRKVWGKVEDAWNPPLGSTENVRAKLESLSKRVADHPWSGRTAHSDRAVAAALIEWAHELGVFTLGASERDVSLRAVVARKTAGKSLQRLQALGLIEPSDTERERTHSQRWVLQLDWGLMNQSSPHRSIPGGRDSYGLLTFLSHPAFQRGALGQTARRVWLDLGEHPGSTAAELAGRLRVTAKVVRQALVRLVDHHLVKVAGTKATRGRPTTTYEVDPEGRLDDVADEYGTANWHGKTADRYERERAGYREVQRRRQQREAPALAAKPATEPLTPAHPASPDYDPTTDPFSSEFQPAGPGSS